MWISLKAFCSGDTEALPTTDSPYNGNLHNADKRLQSQIIPCSLLYNLHIAETSLFWIRHQSHAPTDKININFPWKRTILTYRYKGEKYLLFLKILAILQRLKASLHSRSTKLSNTWHTATGKGRHIIRCTLCIRVTPLLWTHQRGPAVSIIQRFYCMVLFACHNDQGLSSFSKKKKKNNTLMVLDTITNGTVYEPLARGDDYLN